MHSFGEIGTDITFILLHLLMLMVNIQIMDRKAFNPSVVFSFVWFSVILLHFICKFTILDELYALSLHTYLIFFAGTVFFTVGSYIGKMAYRNRELSRPSVTADVLTIHPLLKYGLLAIVLVGLPFYIRSAYQIFLRSNAEELLKGIRTELSDEADFGPTKYLITLSFVTFCLNLFSYFTEKKGLKNVLILVLSLLVSLVYVFFATGRSMFLILLVLYFGMAYLHNKKFSLRKIAFLSTLFIVVFTLIGLFWYDKGGNDSQSGKENAISSTRFTAVYFVTPLSAFNSEIENGLKPVDNGDYTLRFFIKVSKSLGIKKETTKVQQIVDDYSFVPYPTNVYTYYYHYIKDFGLLYGLYVLLFFGLLHTIIFLKAVNTKSFRFSAYYAFLLDSVVISFFQDNYLVTLSFWIQIVFYIELVLFVNRILNRISFPDINFSLKPSNRI